MSHLLLADAGLQFFLFISPGLNLSFVWLRGRFN